MDISNSDDSDGDEDWIEEKPCGKQGLGLDSQEVAKLRTVRVIVNGKVVGEGKGAHVKGAKKQAAVAALESFPWDLE